MTYEFHFDRARNIFIVTGHGWVTMEDIRAAAEARYEGSGYGPGMWLMMDYTDIDPASVGELDVREYQR